jgi:NhaA family Na+:H+ antiporter
VAPPEAWAPLFRFAQLAGKPLERFLRIEAASGVMLLVAALIALVWANSPWSHAYHALWHTSLGAHVGPFALERSLEWFVNDVLMVVFFFVVGLEIRREVQKGELSELRRAALPVLAALGGMVVPALVYLAVAGSAETRHGWGVPMATDIAFALGILALLGRRVPAALRVLLLALAVIDDLGAIVVIALFYSAGIAWHGLGIAVAGIAVIFALQFFGVRLKAIYVLPGVMVWAGIYAAGVHPTIAGVIIGLLTPTRAWLGPDGFTHHVGHEVRRISDASDLSTHELASALKHVDRARREAISPAEALIEALHPWVAFVIMPTFALANAGVSLGGVTLDGHAATIALGTSLGLVIGKPVGVILACFVAIRLGIAKLPLGLGSRHLTVLGLVAGIGFTMALFVAQLAFSNVTELGSAKLGVLCASGVAAVLTLVVGRLLLPRTIELGAAECADDAEASTEC